MKILINTPHITSLGGVANHYLGLKPYFSKKVFYNQYFTSGEIEEKVNIRLLKWLIRFVLLIFDYIKFVISLLYHKKPIILLNPSFGKTALKRDAEYLKIANFLGCKVAVFIHGWDKDYLQTVLNNKILFSQAWYKADAYFVLATEFKDYLLQLGIKAPIHLTSTKVNDKLVDGIETKNIEKIKTLLFLARVEKAKGIFTAIDAFEIVSKKYPYLKLKVVGRGNALAEAKEYANKKDLQSIVFTGPLSGDALKTEFTNADLYILPTTHGEGMPTSVLEAMAFGLPVITRPVGGLVDFFENGKMGYMIESLNPADYAEKIEFLINNLDKTNEIANYNMQYARKHFMASKVAVKLETILKSI